MNEQIEEIKRVLRDLPEAIRQEIGFNVSVGRSAFVSSCLCGE
jgi:hypothetical protein